MTTDSICSSLEEIYKLKQEIKTRNNELKEIRERVKELEQDVFNYLDEKDLPAVKYKNLVVFADKKETRGRKKKKDKERDCVKTLADAGIKNPKDIFDKVLEAMKGEKTNVTKLKLKNITN